MKRIIENISDLYPETIKTVKVLGKDIDIIGYYNENVKGYDFYDIFIAETGECLNEGSPFYKIPTMVEIKEYVSTPEKTK